MNFMEGPVTKHHMMKMAINFSPVVIFLLIFLKFKLKRLVVNKSTSKLLYDWRLAADQFVLASRPSRLPIRDFFFFFFFNLTLAVIVPM
jgi:hypothetical protein